MAGMRVEMRPDEGQAMRSSPLRRPTWRLGCRNGQLLTEFRCSLPQRDEKSPSKSGNRGNICLKPPGDERAQARECSFDYS